MILLLLSAFSIMGASLVGVFSLWKSAGRVVEHNLHFLVSFSAGVFLVVTYGLAQEAMEHAASVPAGLAWIFAGALVVWVVSKVLPSAHSHAEEHEAGGSLDSRRLLISDGLHNIGDGIFLAASFAAGPVLGITAAISIFMHELLQEISEFFVLRDAGFSARKALLVNFAVSSTVLIGAIGGYFLLDTFEVLEAPLLGVAAGAFLIVVLHDLIPHSVRDARTPKHYAQHLVWFSLGVVLMFGISLLAPHS